MRRRETRRGLVSSLWRERQGSAWTDGALFAGSTQIWCSGHGGENRGCGRCGEAESAICHIVEMSQHMLRRSDLEEPECVLIFFREKMKTRA